jgi:hypothetical protein
MIAPTKAVGAHLHQGDEELPRGLADRLLAIAEPLDCSGGEAVEVDLKVLAGDDSGGGERLEAALRDAEVGVPRQIHAGVHQLRDLRGRQPAARRRVQRLMQPLHPGQALLGVLGARCLQRRLHFPRAGSATERALGFRAHGAGGEARGKRPDLKGREGGSERAHAQRDEQQAGWDFRWLCALRPLTFRILPL